MDAVFFSQGLMRNSRMAKTTIYKYCPKWAHSQVYLRTYKDRAIRQPKLYPGKYTGPDAGRMDKPIVPRRKAGRPRKERIGKRKSGTAAQRIAQRMPTVYYPEYAALMEHI